MVKQPVLTPKISITLTPEISPVSHPLSEETETAHRPSRTTLERACIRGESAPDSAPVLPPWRGVLRTHFTKHGASRVALGSHPSLLPS